VGVDERCHPRCRLSNKAWPNKQYDGSAEKYEEYELEKEAWTIRDEYEEHLTSTDPKKVPRVEQSYTVPADDENDPHGPPGTEVPAESENRYSSRLQRDAKLNKKIWAEAIVGFSGEARKTVLSAEKYDAREVFAEIEKQHGTKTSKQVTSIVRDFQKKSKKPNECIKSFNASWKGGLRVMEANNMTLPEQYVINLYLMSLGNQYNTLENMVQVMPEDKKKLPYVMKLAEDQIIKETDEANNDNIAFMACALAAAGYEVKQKTTSKRKHSALSADHRTKMDAKACYNCGKLGHRASECFSPGGGLSSLTAAERATYLQQKQRQRWRDRELAAGFIKKTQDQTKSSKQTESALSVVEKHHHNNNEDEEDRAYEISRLQLQVAQEQIEKAQLVEAIKTAKENHPDASFGEYFDDKFDFHAGNG